MWLFFFFFSPFPRQRKRCGEVQSSKHSVSSLLLPLFLFSVTSSSPISRSTPPNPRFRDELAKVETVHHTDRVRRGRPRLHDPWLKSGCIPSAEQTKTLVLLSRRCWMTPDKLFALVVITNENGNFRWLRPTPFDTGNHHPVTLLHYNFFFLSFSISLKTHLNLWLLESPSAAALGRRPLVPLEQEQINVHISLTYTPPVRLPIFVFDCSLL